MINTSLRKLYFICIVLFLSSCGFLVAERPIHKASYEGDLSEVKRIIENDPNQVNIQDNLGKTPLYFAAVSGHAEIVEFLLAHNADIELGNFMNERPLSKAAKFGKYDAFNLLLQSGADVNCKDDFGQTPLHEAATGGDINIVKLLITHGADILVKNNYDHTPKDRALKYGHKGIVQLLEKEEIEIKK